MDAMCAVHGFHAADQAHGKARQALASFGKSAPQQAFSFPVDVSMADLRKIDCEADALAVAIEMSGHKLATIAAAVNKSEGYVSRLRAGKRAIPDALIPALCRATGTNLVKQFRDMERALAAAAAPESRMDRIARHAREIVRNIR